jgi:hypothetical protein
VIPSRGMTTHAFCLTALLIALAPTAGQASVFVTSGLPASVSGKQEGGSVTFMLDGQKLTCGTYSYAGTLNTEAAESMTLTPTMKECKLGETSATVELKECKYTLHAGEEVGEAEFAGTEDLSCPEGQVIKISAGTCVAEIGTQNGLAEVAYGSEPSETEPSGFNTADGVTGLKYKTTDGFLCPFTGSGEKTNGEITGSMEFTATDEESAPVSVAASAAWIDPLVRTYTGTNQTTTMWWVTDGPGEYKFWGQQPVEALNFEWVEKAGTTTCKGVFTVIKGELKACQFRIKTLAGAVKGSVSEVITVWSPKTAKVGQPLKSWADFP